MREMREKFGVRVKAFTPAFVIPRHAPGWEAMDGGEAGGMVFKPSPAHPPAASRGPGAKRAVAIEIKRSP